MRIDILTLFPNMMDMFFKESIVNRAQKKGLAEVCFHDLHDQTRVQCTHPLGQAPCSVRSLFMVLRLAPLIIY